MISLSDPCSAWTAKANRRVQFGYGLNYLIDNEHAIIVDVEATPARTYDEVAATRTMLDRTEERLALKPGRSRRRHRLWHGQVPRLLTNKGIEPHIPVWDMSRPGDGTFARADFVYDKERDIYVCPNGKELRTSGCAERRAFAFDRHRHQTLPDDRLCPRLSHCRRGWGVFREFQWELYI